MFFDTSSLKLDELFLELHQTVVVTPGKEWADCYYFKIKLTDGLEVGHCEFRIGNTKKLYFVGNIGYTIFESFRGNHYAGKACMLMFELARKHEMEYLYITCNPDNYASRKTCEYIGGILETIIDLPTNNEMYLEGERKKCIYRFNLN